MGVFLLIFFFLKALDEGEGRSSDDRTGKVVVEKVTDRKAKNVDRITKMTDRKRKNVQQIEDFRNKIREVAISTSLA